MHARWLSNEKSDDFLALFEVKNLIYIIAREQCVLQDSSFAIFLQVDPEGAPDRPPADEAVQRRVSAGDHRER